MRAYRPTIPFNVPMRLMVPTTENVKGVTKKTFPKLDDCPVFFGSFRTFGGTERMSNDVYTIENTATIDTWYDPSIKADCRIAIAETGDIYEIISDPEDINMRHQYLQFKVRKVGGRA